MAKDDGGPAFPPGDGPIGHRTGMTLRDWFAGQALIVLAMSDNGSNFDKEATLAYKAADAMLAARGDENE